jgi:hypothetical protein
MRLGWVVGTALCLGFVAAFSNRIAAATPTFGIGVAVGTVTAPEISEASGIIASRQNPGVLWTHNDTEYPGNVFAISTNGTLLGRYYVPAAWFGDFEDISFGPGPTPEQQYIYLGDIGDNYSSRPYIRVFRFPEPAVYFYQSNTPPILPVPSWQEITLTYPDHPDNAEAMMVDPITGDLFIVTKLATNAALYRATRAQLDSGAPVTLTFVREMSFSGLKSVSGGDISADGALIALRRNGKAWLWTRQPSQSVGDVLAGIPIAIPNATEPNGEAIGFHPTGLGYYTLSEGYGQTVYYFRRTDSGVPRQPTVFIKRGEVWRYQDQGTNEGTAWRQRFFNDAAWTSGAAQLGYGQGDEATVISFGPDASEKIVTTYFRKQFARTATPVITNLALRVCFTDGVAVYLNGTEVLRRNLGTNAPFNQPAFDSNSERQNYWLSFPVNPTLLVTGTNTVGVELHRFDGAQPDLSFDLQLLEGIVELAAHFTGPPRISAGVCRIDIAGPAGSIAQIESSSDFQQWTFAGQVTLTGGGGQFQDNSTDGQRFYRLRNY